MAVQYIGGGRLLFVTVVCNEAEDDGKARLRHAGKGSFARVSGFAAKSGEFATPYLDNMEARFEEQDRMTVRSEPAERY
ncbi:hypothetical protein [Bradyrhizobium sp. CB2312]|uniref:hypothetical protein n=1 Tax=Bradyrhizobium sp. CB2312 TaxID=3039155 RepID=UPI0024B0688B|nr:hypothetical protein [Bradyrhizobium sp. CB2312]WFU75510.1 hypothetical protein QA642_16615 [Bradyrhizobium sp. CB2312]